MNAKFLSLTVAALLASSAFAADFSKHSQKQLIELAGKVKPADYPDYRIELHKRIENMKVSEAREFREKLGEAKRAAYDKMTTKQAHEYRGSVRVELQKRIDSMPREEAIKLGLIGPKHGHKDKAGKKKPPHGNGMGAGHPCADGAPCVNGAQGAGMRGASQGAGMQGQI